MITVTSLKVQSFDLDYLDIFWTIPETSENIEQYDFYVLRSIDGMGGPFKQIAGPFYNTFQFRDPDVQRLHKWRHYYYKLRTVHRASGDTKEYGPAYLSAPPDLLSLEMQRREALLLREFTGRKALLFPQLTFGQRCGQCWDLGPQGNYIGRSTQQNCATCFDTTFVGGYATPILFYVQIDPAAKMPQMTDTGEQQPITAMARTLSYPPIKGKDMIVESENIRWRVIKVTPTEKLRGIVRQEIALEQYTKSNIKYKVPVDGSLFTDPSPSRAFTRPMSLQSEKIQSLKNKIV